MGRRRLDRVLDSRWTRRQAGPLSRAEIVWLRSTEKRACQHQATKTSALDEGEARPGLGDVLWARRASAGFALPGSADPARALANRRGLGRPGAMLVLRGRQPKRGSLARRSSVQAARRHRVACRQIVGPRRARGEQHPGSRRGRRQAAPHGRRQGRRGDRHTPVRGRRDRHGRLPDRGAGGQRLAPDTGGSRPLGASRRPTSLPASRSPLGRS